MIQIILFISVLFVLSNAQYDREGHLISDEYYFDYLHMKNGNNVTDFKNEIDTYEIVVKGNTCIAMNSGNSTNPFFRVKFKDNMVNNYKCDNLLVLGFPYVTIQKGTSETLQNLYIFNSYIKDASFTQTQFSNLYLFSPKFESSNALCGAFDYKNKICLGHYKVNSLGVFGFENDTQIQYDLRNVDSDYIILSKDFKIDGNDNYFSQSCPSVSVSIESTTMRIKGVGYVSKSLTEKYKSSNINTITIENGIVSIKNNSFTGFNASTIHLPDTLVDIGDYAFSDMPNLQSITIPPAFLKTHLNWFNNCNSLKTISILYSGNKPSRMFVDGTVPSLKSVNYCGKFISVSDDRQLFKWDVVFNVKETFAMEYKYLGNTYYSSVDYLLMGDQSICPPIIDPKIEAGCQIDVVATIVSAILSFAVSTVFFCSLFVIPAILHCCKCCNKNIRKIIKDTYFIILYLVVGSLYIIMPIISFVMELDGLDYLPEDSEELTYTILEFVFDLVMLLVTWFLMSVKMFAGLEGKQYWYFVGVLAAIFGIFVIGFIVMKIIIIVHQLKEFFTEFGVDSVVCATIGEGEYTIEFDVEKVAEDIESYASTMHKFLEIWFFVGAFLTFIKDVVELDKCCGKNCVNCETKCPCCACCGECCCGIWGKLHHWYVKIEQYMKEEAEDKEIEMSEEKPDQNNPTS